MPRGLPFLLPIGPVPSAPVGLDTLDIPQLVKAAKESAASGATEFCIVAAVRGPNKRLMDQVREGVKAIKAEVDIHVVASLGILTDEQIAELQDMGIGRYNHNLETARSFFPNVVTTHTWEERTDTLNRVACRRYGGLHRGHFGDGRERWTARRVRRSTGRMDPARGPDELPDPRPGTPFADVPVL